MGVADRAGVTADVPELDADRRRCWSCRDWYTWPTGDDGYRLSFWPKYDRAIACSYCPQCAEKINQRRESNDGPDQDV